jgi:hypothetical protein
MSAGIIFRLFFPRISRRLWAAPAVAAIIMLPALAAPKRCDLLLNNTPDPNTNPLCLDLKTDSIDGGPLVQTENNVTRISHYGIKFCANAFKMTTSGNADVVFIMDNAGSMQYGDPHSCSQPGDPTFSRANVVKRGMALERALANMPAATATAGFISFNGPDTNGIQRSRLQPLLNISQSNPNGAINLATLQSKVIADSGLPNPDSCNRSYPFSTEWGPSINIALSWLADTTRALSHNPAIVLVSDGAVGDYISKVKPLVLAGQVPPVFGIHLGESLDNQGLPDQASGQLRELDSLTGGLFFHIAPTDTAALRRAMDSIVYRLATRAVPPSGLQIINTASGQQTSRAVSLATGLDGNMNVVLDSVLALKKTGINTFIVKIDLPDGSSLSYPFRVQADGPSQLQSTTSIACYDPAELKMLNLNGVTPRGYDPKARSYSFRLTRSPCELSTVKINAISKDPLNGLQWGDQESVDLPLSVLSSSTLSVNQTTAPYPFNGNSLNPSPNNGALETDANGEIILRWAHPRDPRDSALFDIRAFSGNVTVQRTNDVFKGGGSGRLNFPAGANPVVLRGVSPPGTSIVGGLCKYNCRGDGRSDGMAEDITSVISDDDNTPVPSFVVRTDLPFSFSVALYDNLGRFVNKAADSIQSEKWQSLNRDSTGGVPVVLSLVPVSRKGDQLGTGVYILRSAITIRRDDGVSQTSIFQTKFGYRRP